MFFLDYADQILTDFTCLKEMEVHNLVTPPEPYFKFHLNWIMGQYLSDVDSAVVEFVIYNSRTGKTRNEHTPTTINVTEISQVSINRNSEFNSEISKEKRGRYCRQCIIRMFC